MKIVSTLKLKNKYREMLRDRFPGITVNHADALSALGKEELGQVEVLLTYGNGMPEELVSRMTSLRWIHSGQAGIDAMPKELLHDMGVAVTNSRGINSITIAEYVMNMMLNIVRNQDIFYDAYKEKRWDMTTRLDELAGKSVGILGMGMVGRETAKRAKAFDMQVYGLDRGKSDCEFLDRSFTTGELKGFLPICDFVIICMPLTDETCHMFSGDVFEWMKETAVLMNVGRGPIVKEEDLIEALDRGKLAGAVLDVMETEPLPAHSPLWTMEHVMITPHIAGDRQASYIPRMMEILCHNLSLYPNVGAMKNPVNLTQGY